MSGKDIGLAGYEPGNGYQPARLGLSRRDLPQALAIVAGFAIITLLRTYLGDRATSAAMYSIVSAALLAAGIYQMLRAERFIDAKTGKGARRVRIEGAVLALVGAGVATMCILCLWEGYAIDSRWLGFAYLAMVSMSLAFGTFPLLARQLRPDGEEEPDEAPISPRRGLIIAVLLIVALAIMAGSPYLEEIEGLGRRGSALGFSISIVLLGLLAAIVPRNQDAEVDMRPAWAVTSVFLAIFIYFMFSV